VGCLVLATSVAAFRRRRRLHLGGARGTNVQKSDGTVWTWGANFGGKLGVVWLHQSGPRARAHGSSWPARRRLFHSVTAILAGTVHNIALKSDGTDLAWGANMFGQLGNGSTNEAHTPVKRASSILSLLSAAEVITPSRLIAPDRCGVWGWNSAGELGDGTTNPTTVPVKVVGLTNPAVVSAGYKFSIALMTNVRCSNGVMAVLSGAALLRSKLLDYPISSPFPRDGIRRWHSGRIILCGRGASTGSVIG